MISVLAFLLFILTTAVSAAAPVALPGCPETCGNITVPYPFGTRPGCFREGFNLTCEETPGRRPKLLVGDGVEVFGISLPEGTLRVHSKMLGFQLPTFIQLNASWSADLMATGRRLVVSTRHNRFVAMGCNLLASLAVDPDAASDSTTSYVSVCADDFEAGDTSCSGIGCCQTPIALGLPSYRVQLISEMTVESSGVGMIPASGVGLAALFIADQEWFSRKGSLLQLDYFGDRQRTIDTEVIPTVLELGLGIF